MKVKDFFELRMNISEIKLLFLLLILGALNGESFTKMHSLSWDLTLHSFF